MALFSGETKEEKKERKTNALLEKYGLQELTDPRDLQAVEHIAQNLAGNKLISAGTALSGKPFESAMLTFQQAIIEQNFIMIRQLERIMQSMEK